MKFSEFNITKQYLNALEDLGFTEATEIQKEAIPKVIGGSDIIGVAQTGTGKTAAYMLPLLRKLNYAQGMNCRALVLVPTKELALQVEEMSLALAKYTDLRIVALYGGIGWKAQAETIEKGIDIIIATPGRFVELYSRGVVITKQIKTLVLDEADRMMDMGFMGQLREILDIIPVKRQNLLFSATFNERIEKLSEEFLDFPIKIEVSNPAVTPEKVKQVLYEVPNHRTKIELLKELLSDEEVFNRVLVFVRKKEEVENIAKFIRRKNNEEVKTIHSNKGQNARINSMNAFKEGDLRVLIATDVASRGIDVTGVSHVINFDVPRNYEDYVHRIGRTGRAKMEGTAISFVNKAEAYHVKKIEKLIDQKISLLQLPESIEVFPTSKTELKEMEMEIDVQKRREDPSYKGAFHQKKRFLAPKNKKEKKNRPPKNRR
jgi:ATP-dependent RNA helicase RhlE